MHPISSALILAGCLHATVKLYRCTHLQEQFAQLGIQAEVQDWVDQPFPASVADRYDLLILQRTALTANLRRLIDQMQAQGKLVLFDTDDLVFEPAMTAWHRGVLRLSPAEQELYVDGVQRILATLNACDGVLAASPLLAELAQRRGKPAWVHRNAVGREMQVLGDQLYIGPERQENDRIIIGYGSGTPTHDIDFEVAVPALLDILSRYPQVTLWLMGPLATPPALDLFGKRVRRYPLTGWQEYLSLASRLDIVLAPLEPGNIFCRAKSEIKFVEAGLLGIPTVASRIDPFEYAIESGVDGFLAATAPEWIDALDTLITQPELRNRLGQAAREKVIKRYSLAARTADLAETLAKVSTIGAGNGETRRLETGDWRQGIGQQKPENEHTVPNPTPHAPPPDVPLVLNWIVTEPFRGSGGHLGVFRMIRYLVEFGHECHVYVVPVEKMHHLSAEEIRRFVDYNILVTGAHFHRWSGRVQEADATIATYWSTVNDVLTLPNPGRRYYFVQDFEPLFYPVGSDYLRAENSYRQGFHCITLGPWLARLIRERFQAQADHFDFGVDLDVYWPQPQPRPAHPRVAFYARPSTPRRAYELGIEALRLVKARYPETEIILFGANDLPAMPFMGMNAGIRNPWELATLYSSCHVGLVLSLTNPSFVPFEMMACKCAVIDLCSERVEGLLVDRENALLAEPTPESIADAVLELLWDKTLHTAITERAYEQVQQHSWQSSARQIERILLDHAPPPTERRFTRRVYEQDADGLLWQIHQLLDRHEETTRQTLHLHTLLRRTLEEKAALAEQLRRTEEALQAYQRAGRPVSLLRSAPVQVLEQAPGWVLNKRPLGKLPIGPAPVEQQFAATASHLCQIELLFTPAAAATGSRLHIVLYDLVQPETPIVDRMILATEIPSDRPFLLDFAPQPYSNGRSYRLTLLAADSQTFAHALWRSWAAPPETQLFRGGRRLRGQLLFHPGYQAQAASAGRVAAAPWTVPPQPLSHALWQVGKHSVREGSRLAQKSWQALRTQGAAGLMREATNYLRWRLGGGAES
ncbi:MAG: hypothetical protein DCC55_04250 [Chloroflexi bacterium]|nr:MAG: hypothetical protein DCC55_04250 [Chloroflexota bacterium]